ncbi:hypothetical protein ACR31S_08190 [Streptococcus iniae]
MGLFDRLFGTKKRLQKEEDMPLTAEVVEEQVEAEDSNKQEDLQDSDSSLHDNAALLSLCLSQNHYLQSIRRPY